VPTFYPVADPGVALPSAVLLLAGLGLLVTAGLRQLRTRHQSAA
jgi:hypothetical protein